MCCQLYCSVLLSMQACACHAVGVVLLPQHMLLTSSGPPCSGISALSSLTLLALTGAVDLDPLRLADALSRLTGLSTLAISAWSLPGGTAGTTWGVGLGVCSSGAFSSGTVSGGALSGPSRGVRQSGRAVTRVARGMPNAVQPRGGRRWSS